MTLFESVTATGVLAAMLISTPSGATEQGTEARTAIVNPAGLYDPAPNGYSHAVVAKGGSRIAYIAGQGGEDASGRLSPQFSKLGVMTQAVKRLFGDALPAQTLVPVPRLALDGMLFEVDAVAVLD